ncbi:serine/threonine-protein kinase [Kitasatospora sp. DSM 101779]|uniref:serine/threonine-protein kinase n=1 Tax=Kitasatospora sp. DSM 101779 TaxID=2853165 RepID=UPI0021D9D855|nr:serine/threonine-protein kinase [Kitasatospora sp. DSM 101779]
MGDYRLVRRLGAGGMGQVFLGRTAGGRTVAVKMVHPPYAADQEFRLRFRQEVAAARRVGGRWTAPVLDADTESDHPWVATGYVAGPPLGSAVREFGPLPSAAVRSLGIGLAEALKAVHGLGLVHRDVKPSNVLLALDGPRLIDFGISRALEATTPLTRSGFVIGSPGYLSPEQAEGRTVDPASDVFSLGAVLAYAATGVPPFGAGVSTPVLLYRVLHEEPDLGGLDTADPELRDLVSACLAKNPAERPTPARIGERLAAGDSAAADRLTERGWLPSEIAGSLARLAVELLDLDLDAAAAPGGHPDGLAPPPLRPASRLPDPGHHGPTVPGATAVPPPPPAHPPRVTAAASPPAGIVTPVDSPPTEIRSRRGRTALVVAATAAATAAVVAGTAVHLFSGHRNHVSGAGQPAVGDRPTVSSVPSAPAPASASPSSGGPASQTPAGAVPTALLGTWQGPLTSPQNDVRADFTITLAQGRQGEPVGTIRNNTGAGTRYCDSVANLISVGTDRLVLKTRPLSILTGCAADPHEQVYTRNADGSLHLSVGAFSGDLARQ